MKITKYEHACLVIEESGKKLVIDPGSYSQSLPDLSDVVAIVITHVHPDHLDKARLANIMTQNPEAVLVTVQAVANELATDYSPRVVTGGNNVEIGPFKLDFSGGKHALVHKNFPITDNVGVLVNKTLYYPGDSFDTPGEPVNILAAPTSGPFLKMGEVIDLIKAVKPKICFPTHDAHLSELGHNTFNPWFEQACEPLGVSFKVIKPGESISV